MIRPAQVSDTPGLVSLASSSGLFQEADEPAIRAMLDQYHSEKIHHAHQILTFERAGAIVGMAYFAPKEFADRVWELLMIAVDATHHRQGIGSELLLAVESHLRSQGGRLLLIETSSKSSFERTREFYRKHGYANVAHIPDYFTDGDGKASFLKRL